MKTIYILILVTLISCTTSEKKETTEVKSTEEVNADNGIVIQSQSEPDTLKGSLKAFVEGKIGETTIKINYYSPAVRRRMIWGGLVAFDNVWVTGAHKATNIEFDKPAIINDQEIPAGKYGFFTIPGKDKWIVILNKNWNQHLADNYDSKEDVLRFEVTPISSDANQERLMYSIESNETGGKIVVRWEKLRIEIPIQSK